jgi:predicted Zn-dependent protease
MTASPPLGHSTPASPALRGRLLWRGALLVLVAASLAAGWLGWHRREARRTLREALHLAEQGAFTKAEPKLRAALARDADNPLVLKALALGLLGSDRLDEAEPILARWCNLRSADAQPYRLRMHLCHRIASQGKTEAEQRRLQELALHDGLQALELEPADAQVAQEVIWLGVVLGRFEDADRVCRQARQRRPDDPSLVYLQACVWHGRGANREAQALLDALLPRQPGFTRGLLLRAILHTEAGEPDRAIPMLRQVIARGSALQHEARYQLGLALARAGQADEARRVLNEVQRRNLEQVAARAGHAEHPAVQVRRAELLLGVGQADEALRLLQAVLKDDPGYSAAHLLLASYHEKRGELQKAAEHRRAAAGDQGRR